MPLGVRSDLVIIKIVNTYDEFLIGCKSRISNRGRALAYKLLLDFSFKYNKTRKWRHCKQMARRITLRTIWGTHRSTVLLGSDTKLGLEVKSIFRFRRFRHRVVA